MAGIADLLNLDSGVGAQFLASVLGALVQAVLGPEFEALSHIVNAETQNAILSPEILADMVERGHITEDQAAQEAAQSGLGPERFHRLVLNNGNPPGPGELAEALRRGFIPMDAGGDTAPSYMNGIRQSRLQTQWAQVIEQLDKRLPGPATAVEAAVRSLRDPGEIQRLFTLYGGDPEQYQLLYDVAGEGPTPVEAGVLANRRIIPWTGTGAAATSFEQAVAESRFKNKWTEAYRELATYRPPPRTVVAMWREGSLSDEDAKQFLLDYGVPAAVIPSYLKKATNSSRQTAHTITESQIVHLYTERALSADEAKQHLTDLGFTQPDIDLIIASADLEYHAKVTTLTINVIKNLYTHQHIDANGAIQRLDAAGIAASYRDALLAMWDLEVQAGLKSLTVKQIMDMNAMGILDANGTMTKLRQAGYSEEDAGLLYLLSNPTQFAQAAGLGITNEPGAG